MSFKPTKQQQNEALAGLFFTTTHWKIGTTIIFLPFSTH